MQTVARKLTTKFLLATNMHSLCSLIFSKSVRLDALLCFNEIFGKTHIFSSIYVVALWFPTYAVTDSALFDQMTFVEPKPSNHCISLTLQLKSLVVSDRI